MTIIIQEKNKVVHRLIMYKIIVNKSNYPIVF